MEGANEIHGGGGNDSLIAIDDLNLDPENPEGSLAFNADTPATPDQLFGGSGDDGLDGDRGDTLTGGEGSDHFWTWHYSEDADPVEITDFSAEDRIILQVTPNLISQEAFDANPQPDFTTDPNTGDVTVSYDGITLVMLKGPISLEPRQIGLSIYNT